MSRKSVFNFLSRGFLIIAGILCILHAPYITKWFPYLIGGLMIFSGVTMFFDTYPILRNNDDNREKYSSRLTRSILLLMLGIITVFIRSNSMPFIGVVWGLLGLFKGGRGITAFICFSKKDKKAIIILIKAIVGIVLSCLLLFNPINAVGKHISLLGIQIIYFAIFKIDYDKHPKDIVNNLHEQIDEITQIGRNNN